jgi:hypothetical protein
MNEIYMKKVFDIISAAPDMQEVLIKISNCLGLEENPDIRFLKSEIDYCVEKSRGIVVNKKGW